MKKKYLTAMVIAAISILSTTMLAEQDIAIVNMDKVFSSYYKTKIENTRIKKQTDIYREYIVTLNKSREKLQQEFVKLRDASQNIVYSDTERENSRISAQNKYRQLQAKDVEIQQYNQEKRAKLGEEFKKIKDVLVKEMIKVVQSIGVRENYALVLDSSGSSLNTIPTVVYHDKYIDITNEVVKQLNLGHGSEK
jgi:Skp family chaperone for outer membrane proteins